MKKLNVKGVTTQTWIRTVVLIVALLAELLVILGKRTDGIDIDKTAEVVTHIFTIISSIWSWWKNNSFTGKAQKADELLHGEEDFEIPYGENETGLIIDEKGNITDTIGKEE